jgi:hypothetical protein
MSGVTMTFAQEQFQRTFLAAIYQPEQVSSDSSAVELVQQLHAQPGFNVYRNTVLKASVDALAANYPSVVQLVGLEWFRAVALIHVSQAPPESVCLIEYGRQFADFLRHFEGAAELSYLADVAVLDRYWTECHIAADTIALDATQLALVAPQELLTHVLQPAAAVRWHWSSTQPAYSIWQAQRSGTPVPDELVWQGEGALLSRIDGQVIWQPASLGMCHFLDACAAGEELQSAAARAMAAEPALDMAELLSSLIQAQVFAG